MAIIAANDGGGSLAVLVVNCSVIFSTIASVYILGEKLSTLQIIGMAIAIFGITFMLSADVVADAIQHTVVDDGEASDA